MTLAHPPVTWRFVLSTLEGTKISILTTVVSDMQLQFALNRPAMCTFTVPSDDAHVNITYDDGYPFLSCGNRLVWGYRKVSTSTVETPGGWELRFIGRVWSLEDQGDGDTCMTQITCYDHLKILGKRVVRDSSGNFNAQVKWWGVPGTTIIKDMVDRTNTYAGITRIDTNTDAWTDSPVQTAAYDQAYVLPSLQTLCDTGTCDISVRYDDGTIGGNPGYLILSGSPRLGSDKPGVIFGYAGPPRTAATYDRTQTLDDFANSVTAWGKSVKGYGATAFDTTSQGTYDVFEDVEIYQDIETQELVTALVEEELALRKLPQDAITVAPLPEIAARPWDDYWLGDTVRVRSSTSSTLPSTREAVIGIQRIYGFTVNVDPDAGETVTDVLTSQQAESS